MADAQIIRLPRRRAITRTNLITNPSAEVDSTGYTALLGGSGVAWAALANSTTSTQFGLRNSVVVCTTASTGAGGGIAYGPGGSTLSPAAGKSYAASGHVYISTIAQRMALTVEWTDAGGTTVGTVTGDHVIVPAYTWTRLAAIGVPPLTAVSARLRFASITGASFRNWAVNDQVRVDALLLEPSTEIKGYFDGGWAAFPAVPGAAYAWLGAANASASQETIPDPADVTTPLLTLADSMTLNNPTNNTVHKILGAPLVIVTQQPMGGREGSLQFLFATASEVDAFIVNLRGGSAFDLYYPEEPTIQFRFALGEGEVQSALDSETQTAWVVTVPVVEVTL